LWKKETRKPKWFWWSIV